METIVSLLSDFAPLAWLVVAAGAAGGGSVAAARWLRQRRAERAAKERGSK